MAEAILTRSTLIPDEVLNPIYPSESYHKVLVTLKTYKGGIVQNYNISCLDGTSTYNYITNQDGQVLFTCNSGSANIFVNNIHNGVHYIDFSQLWTNIGAPIGEVSRLTINLPQWNNMVEFTGSALFSVIENRVANNIILVGGGGGGASSYQYSDKNIGGGGGGAGYLNEYNNFNLIKNNIYNFVVGSGGGGGQVNTSSEHDNPNNGSSGGTSYIVGTNMSAVGGEGGKYATNTSKAAGGNGGLGNGGYGHNIYGQNGYASSVSFAGGGGGGGGMRNTTVTYGAGGTPYGGRGGQFSSLASPAAYGALAGSRGGGGGGGGAGWQSKKYGDGPNVVGKSGGAGLMRINLIY